MNVSFQFISWINQLSMLQFYVTQNHINILLTSQTKVVKVKSTYQGSLAIYMDVIQTRELLLDSSKEREGG